jgi:hypothetical protein
MKVCIVGASGKLWQYMIRHSLEEATRFRDARNRRWEASYNVRARKLDYRRL